MQELTFEALSLSMAAMENERINWILLRGLGLESRHWLDFPRQFRESLNQGRTDNHSEVHCLDLPGVGTEYQRNPPITIAATTDDLRARFIDLSQGRGRWACVGHSMGGMIALDWAKRYPRDFERIVMINSSGKDIAPIHHRLSIFAVYCFLRAYFSKDESSREKQILKMISNLRAKEEMVIRKYAEIAATAPVGIEKLLRQFTASSQFVVPRDLTPAVLVLASLKDKMVDVRCSKLLAEKLGARIKFHATAGHDLALDDAEWTIQRITEFISENGKNNVEQDSSPGL